jgi:hypothetical protein
VLDETGAPLPGAIVAIGHEAPLAADHEGRFRLAVAPGRYAISARHTTRCGTHDVDIEIGSNADDGGGKTHAEVDLTLAPGRRVSGLVRDERGYPLANALVTLAAESEEDAPADHERTRSGTDGRYLFPPICRDHVTVFVYASGYRVQRQQVKLDTDVDDLDFELVAGGTLRVRVLDVEGEPTQAAVTITDVEERHTVNHGSTDDEGRFEIELPTVPVQLRVATDNRGVADVSLELKQGETREITLRLERRGVVSGVARDLRGAPLARAYVRVGIFSTLTDEAGRFSVMGNEPGRYTVYARAVRQGLRAYTTVTIDDRRLVPNLELVLTAP